MKVLFFTRLFYPHVGGVEKHVFNVSKLLIKKGYRVTIITENYQSLSRIDKIEGIDIVRINVGKNDFYKKFRIWKELFKHINLIKDSNIVHCHDIFFWYLPFRFIFPFKKVFTTFHGYEGNNIPGFKEKFWHKLSETLSNGNLCIGSFYKKWYGTNANIVSFGAVDEKLINIGKLNKKPIKQTMFLGRLEEETGIMEYLKVVKDLNLQLDIYGDGSLRKKAEEYVKNNKLKVNFKGFVPNATDYINNYEYIFTSRYLGILEALAVKRPVFALYNNVIKKDYLSMTPFAKFISISKSYLDLEKQFKLKNKKMLDEAYIWIKNETWDKMCNNYLKLWGNEKIH